MEDKVKLLAAILSEHQLTKLSYEEGEVKICLEKALPENHIQYAGGSAPGAVVSAPLPAGLSEPPAEKELGTEEILSPLAGIYYGKPSPEAKHFVREGSRMKTGDTMCIIESMKMMNEIKAPYDLTVVRINKKDEQVAEYNEPLFVVKK